MNVSDVTVHLVDHRAEPLARASVRLEDEASRLHDLAPSAPGRYDAGQLPPGRYHVLISKRGFLTERYEVALQAGRNSFSFSLGRRGQPFYFANRAKVYFETADEQVLFAVRGKRARTRLAEAVSRRNLEAEDPFRGGAERRRSDNQCYLCTRIPGSASDRTNAIREVTQELEAEGLRVTPALMIKRGSSTPQGLTNRLLVQFEDGVSEADASATAARFGLQVKRRVLSAGNAYVLSTDDAPTYDLLRIAQNLTSQRNVVLAEPDLLVELETDQYTPNDALFNLQNHLPLINCDDAWDILGEYDPDLRGGDPGICIAVFDPHGVAPNHPDLTANLTDGTGKLITSFDFVSMSAQTVANLDGDHGTKCAGTATAAFDNSQGIAGVAPNCHLIGAELPSPSSGIEMADAFLWAAGIDNGSTDPAFPAFPSQPADVISNSWGNSNNALSAALQAAFDRLTDEGRDGRGCIVTFSVGNLGYVQFSTVRTYAAYNRTIAVGASINTNPTSPVNSAQVDPNGNTNNIAVAVDFRTLYSPYGPELDIVAPSHTCYAAADGSLVDPTTSSVRVGTGALDGCAGAAVCNDYDTSFGGTSHSSPTIAGVAALIMSANPLLSWDEVRDVLRRTAVRIDGGNTNAIGQWVDNDGDGVAEFSQWYGYGRVDVAAAVQEALLLYIAQLQQLTIIRAL